MAELKEYEIPVTEGLSPEQAKQMLTEIYGDKKHPCLCPWHPMYEDFQTAITELFEIKDGELAEVNDGY